MCIVLWGNRQLLNIFFAQNGRRYHAYHEGKYIMVRPRIALGNKCRTDKISRMIFKNKTNLCWCVFGLVLCYRIFQTNAEQVHLCYELVLDGRLYLAPLNNPQDVLDIGTGRGDWAIDFAE